eukprot:22202-Eustigmatos_ZCMA.PRE.1
MEASSSVDLDSITITYNTITPSWFPDAAHDQDSLIIIIQHTAIVDIPGNTPPVFVHPSFAVKPLAKVKSAP